MVEKLSSYRLIHLDTDQSFILSMFHKGYYCNVAYLNFARVLAKVSTGSGYKKAVVEAKIKVAINGFGRIGRNCHENWVIFTKDN